MTATWFVILGVTHEDAKRELAVMRYRGDERVGQGVFVKSVSLGNGSEGALRQTEGLRMHDYHLTPQARRAETPGHWRVIDSLDQNVMKARRSA